VSVFIAGDELPWNASVQLKYWNEDRVEKQIIRMNTYVTESVRGSRRHVAGTYHAEEQESLRGTIPAPAWESRAPGTHTFLEGVKIP
jgi:hypothetical protein